MSIICCQKKYMDDVSGTSGDKYRCSNCGKKYKERTYYFVYLL